MKGLRVGHYTNRDDGTGLSVFLFDVPAVGAYLLSGSGPASHELAPLDPEGSVPYIHALMLSGGSAFGLYAAEGVMHYLVERGVGLSLPHGVVPIVPAAAIYDLAYKEANAPKAAAAYQACLDAEENNKLSGRIGAGTGATVGKLVFGAQQMTGGIGRAEITLPSGVSVVVYAVVNPVGDVKDVRQQIIAGARLPTGEFADCEKYLFAGGGEDLFASRISANTTLVAVFTDAKFNKAELKRIAKMAIAGMARAITPIFSCYDGDILFSVSLGDKSASVITIGTVAAELVRQAIVNAVEDSEVIA